MQYPVGYNMPIGVPGSEGLKLVSFSNLRAYADLYSVARAAERVRIEEILGLEWDIVPTQEAADAMRTDKAEYADFEERRQKIIQFFKRPDQNYYTYHSWMGALLEDVFVIDAPSLYFHPSRLPGKGVVGSDLAGLELLDGSTIRPLLDLRGQTPRPPNVGYQQYLWGVPRVDMMDVMLENDIEELDGAAPVQEYRADQLIYFPYVRRSWTPYGFSAVERAILPIVTGLKRQQWALDYFTEGTIPQNYVVPGPTINTAQLQRQLQDVLNAIAGDPAWKHRQVVLPPGSSVHEMKEKQLADHFDSEVKESTLMAFEVMPMELGMLPGGRSSGMGGKGVGEQSENTQGRRATKPLVMFIKRTVFDFVIQQKLRQVDMEWKWLGLEEEEDLAKKVTSIKDLVTLGVKSVDDGRQDMGMEPFGTPFTSQPMYFTPTGPVSLVDGQPIALVNAPDEAIQDPTLNEDNPGDTAAGEETAKPASPATVTETPLHSGHDDAQDVPAAEKLAELDQLQNYLRHGKQPEHFIPKALTKVQVWTIAEKAAMVGPRQAFLEARRAIKAAAHLETRNTAILPIQSRLARLLQSMLRQMVEKKGSPITFIDDATQTVGDSYKEAYLAGARDYSPDYVLDSADIAKVEARASSQGQFLQGFVQDVLGGMSGQEITSRTSIYAATVTPVYEQGYGAAFQEENPEGYAIWNILDDDACDLCTDLDGQKFAVSEIDHWPGDGDFGEFCQGGPNCRCWYDFVEGDGGAATAIAKGDALKSGWENVDAYGRWGSGSAGPPVHLTPTTDRAWNGSQVQLKIQLSKQDAGKLGEDIIIAHLQGQGFDDATHINTEHANYAVDAVADHEVIEIKTGLVSNGASAQQWRATIGQPGKAEGEWLKTAKPAEERAWNQAKNQAIMDRKDEALKSISSQLGVPVRGTTMTTIINPDTKTADVYKFDGFHLRIGWKSAAANYVGSYKYK